ncbi:hypothetical protein BX070DRAFT_223341, partial [Coemansia spiralis]
KLLKVPSKPGNEPRKQQTEAKAGGKRLFDLVIEEGCSAKEAALMTGINV